MSRGTLSVLRQPRREGQDVIRPDAPPVNVVDGARFGATAQPAYSGLT